MKRLTLISVSIVLLTNLIYSQSVDVKDGSANTLIQINDEGTTGSITLPSGGTPDPITNKLYNEGGALKWNGTTLATGSSLWTLSSGNIYRSTGNVGIGTTNPSAGLHLVGTDFPNSFMYLEAAAGNDAGFRLREGSTEKWHIFNDASGNEFQISNNAFEPNFIIEQTSGNVGIGITNPSSKLSVGGNGLSTATISGVSAEHNGYGVYGLATNDGGSSENYGGYFKAEGGLGYGVYGLASNTGSVENYGGYFEARGRSGTAVLGFATHNGNGAQDGVNGTALGSVGRGVYGYATGTYGKGVVGNGNTPSTSYDFDAVGNGVNYGATSSIRWKDNIIEINNPLEKLSELRGVYFDWDEEHGGHHDIGCIAEEVGKVLPEIVVYEENGIDADGMDYSKLTPLLVEVAKAQQKLIEDLTKRIEYLESN